MGEKRNGKFKHKVTRGSIEHETVIVLATGETSITLSVTLKHEGSCRRNFVGTCVSSLAAKTRMTILVVLTFGSG